MSKWKSADIVLISKLMYINFSYYLKFTTIEIHANVLYAHIIILKYVHFKYIFLPFNGYNVL